MDLRATPDDQSTAGRPLERKAARIAAGVFIGAWLAVQIVVPLASKFELPSLRYRTAPFGWAMFARPTWSADVSVYRIGPEGDPQAVPEIERAVSGFASPGPTRMKAANLSPEEFQARLTQLVEHLARGRADGATYAATVRWIENGPPGGPGNWEFRTHGRSR